MAAKEATSNARIEIMVERRRMHDPTFRARIVALSLVPGANVQGLARQHGLSPSLIYRWRRLASRQAAPSAPAVRLLPVQVTKAPAEKPSASKPAGLIEIELTNGCGCALILR